MYRPEKIPSLSVNVMFPLCCGGRLFSFDLEVDSAVDRSKISNTFLFLFSKKMWGIRAGNHKMLVILVNSFNLISEHAHLSAH